jgi:hypothetical protein
MGMACRHLIINPPVVIHFMEGRLMGPSSAQAVEGFHGVVAVVEYSAAGEGFVDGKRTGCMGVIDGAQGIGQNLP